MISQIIFNWTAPGLNRPLVVKRASNQTFYDETWIKIWENIASLEGLTHLYIKLAVPFRYHAGWTLHEDDILLPIMKVTRPQKFILQVPFLPNQEGTVRGELGDRVVLRLDEAYMRR